MAAKSSKNATALEEVALMVKWSGTEYTVRVHRDDTVGRLKRRIHQLTSSLPDDDAVLLSQLPLKSMTMIGERTEDEKVAIEHNLTRCITPFKIELRNPCRKGKKLLVLDIDHTLYDYPSAIRPYLHEFLTSVYSEYDIMVWSASRMDRINYVMGRLGVLYNPNYKITALLDQSAMIPVQSSFSVVCDCKPLGLIWAQFPEFYNASNTIMFDDLQRNFVMNPQNGLAIKPFWKAHANQDNDQELMKLTQYLLAIAKLDDLSHLDHKDWELSTAVEVTNYTPPSEKLTKTTTKPSEGANGSASSNRRYACLYEGCGKAYVCEYKLKQHLKREHPGHMSEKNAEHAQANADIEMDEAIDQDAYGGKRSNGKIQKQSKPKPNLKLPPSRAAKRRRRNYD